MNQNLSWRVEQACRAAWVPVRLERAGDWDVALSGGGGRRINSANPARPDAALNPGAIAAVEQIFTAAGQPPIFRVPAFLSPGIDHALDTAGYAPPWVPTRTLLARLDAPPQAAEGVELSPVATDAWLAARERLSLLIDGEPGNYRAPLSRLTVPARFASTRVGEVHAAVAYAAVAHGVVVLEAVATDPAFSRRGLATALVRSLLAWGRDAGADLAALQVRADNAGAIALYRRLGFVQEGDRYHYRRR